MLSELVGLGMLNAGSLRGSLNDVELEVVGLSNCLDGSGAGVVLNIVEERELVESSVEQVFDAKH